MGSNSRERIHPVKLQHLPECTARWLTTHSGGPDQAAFEILERYFDRLRQEGLCLEERDDCPPSPPRRLQLVVSAATPHTAEFVEEVILDAHLQEAIRRLDAHLGGKEGVMAWFEERQSAPEWNIETAPRLIALRRVVPKMWREVEEIEARLRRQTLGDDYLGPLPQAPRLPPPSSTDGIADGAPTM